MDTNSYGCQITWNDTESTYDFSGGTAEAPGSTAADWKDRPVNYVTYDGDGGTDGIGPDYYHTEVGEWENSKSPYDTFDQGGNVWEWNEALIDSYRGLRGGSLDDASDGGGDLQGSYRRCNGYPPMEAHTVGFRVASIPEPGNITLLLCGAIAGLIWWRRRK